MRSFYDPTLEHLEKLSGTWSASYSGGKDSTSLVTWVQWLRRSGQIDCPHPKLVQSDTGVEEQNLTEISHEMRTLLQQSGWQCEVVKPMVHERLYPQILGRGLPPIHPAARGRWCTRSTKIDPMKRVATTGLMLSGVRLGESATRDAKLIKCGAGGECGLPATGKGVYSPIINWTLCQVIDWLSGSVGKEVKKVMGDIFEITGRLLDIYDVRFGAKGFDFHTQEINAARFGCIGCPAIEVGTSSKKSIAKYGVGHPLNELYEVWHEARDKRNRCWQYREKKNKWVAGPIRMEVRKRLFDKVISIQDRADVLLITEEDERFIKQCWKDNVYPKRWSALDELTKEPEPELIQLMVKQGVPTP